MIGYLFINTEYYLGRKYYFKDLKMSVSAVKGAKEKMPFLRGEGISSGYCLFIAPVK